MPRILRFVLASCVFSLLLAVSSAAQSFVSLANLNFTRSDFQTGTAPYAVAVGDFNGDGKADLAVANERDGSVSILLGNGDGTFQPHVDYPTDQGSNSVTVADLRGDGKQDLVVTNGNGVSTVSVLLGNGDGTFQPHVDYDVGPYAYTPVVGDFNGDGILDIIVTNFSDGTFSLLLGNGDGTFQSPQTFPAKHMTGSIAAADFNHDGNLDLAGTDSDNNLVTVYLGDGNGNFSAGVDYAGGSQPVRIAIGDFNGDGNADLAVVNACADDDPECIKGSPGTTSIFLGNGDGTFKPKNDFSASYDSLGITLGDFNGDNKLDVAVANGCNQCNGPGNVTVQLGNGDGTLQPAKAFTVGNLPDGVATGHFDGSGRGSSDIVVANLDSYVGTTVSVLLNDAATRIGLKSSPNPSKQGQTVTLTAGVAAAVKGTGTAGGKVNFYNGSTLLGSGTITKGVATFATSTLPVGTDNIRALYTGSASFNRNLSSPVKQVVQP